MNRLTHQRNNGIKTGFWSPNKKEELVNALAAYEDTGLTPDDVERVNDFEKSQTGHLLKVLGEERKKHAWIPVEERLPEDDDFVLLSFENFSLPMIGKFEIDEDGGGAWYLGDCDEGDTCVSQDLFVNAWMPLPEAYRGED